MQRPILAAGFRVESVLTPPQALALLAASRPRSGNGAVAWLALNMQAAAIAIVHDGELLFARTFEWSYSALNMSGKAQLLQRYSLVAQLAPEVRRGIAAVRASRGLTVEQAVTCGDLPELRSLTMPLIEELDLEVETLDSTDGLHAVGKAKVERFAESAPAIRLACAVALAPSKRRGSATRSVARIAAAVGVISALGWGSYALWRAASISTAATAPSTPRQSAARPAAVPPGPAARGPARATGSPQGRARAAVIDRPGAQGPAVTKPAVVPAPSLAAARPGPPVVPPRVAGDPKVTQPAGRSGAPGSIAQATAPKPTVTPAQPRVEPKPAAPPVTAVVKTPPPKVEPKPAAAPPAIAAVKTPPPIVTAPPRVEPKPATTAPVTAVVKTPPPIVTAPPKIEPRPAAAPPATAKLETGPIVTPSARVVAPPAMRAEPAVATASPGPAARPFPGAPRTFEPPAPNAALRTAEPRAPAPGRPLAPLKDALPKVDSILIDQERRLAIVDGTIVSIGDTVGPRVVVQIDPAGVVLREPSGLSVRIALRVKTTL